MEIDAQAARDKVSHALRFAARQQKKTPIEQSDDNSSQGSSGDEASNDTAPIPPPPMPARQEMERNTTNVEELFAAFDQTLTGPIVDEPLDHQRPIRRDSARLLLSFLSTVDFDDDEETEETSLVGQSFSFDLGLDYTSTTNVDLHDHTVTQWAAC